MNQTVTRSRIAKSTYRLPHLELELGGRLNGVEVAYETYGTLNNNGTNAILICHALTGDASAYGPEASPGWWQDLIGPGKTLDTERYFLVCSNVLGGCNGTTGPQSVNPDTGRPYGSAFPSVTIRDMVQVQHALLRHLGVQRLHTVIGGSMGGLQALEWAVTYPQLVERCIPIATSAALSAMAIAYNDAMRTAVHNDPNWQGGDYYGSEGPVQGLSLARKIGMITYRTYELFQERFGRDTTEPAIADAQARFQIGSYLDYAGHKLVGRFDAGSYLALIQAMDLHDIGRGRGGIDGAALRIRSHLLWVGIDTDHLFPAVEQRAWAERLRALGKHVTYREIRSPFGHDAFLIEYAQMAAMIAEFLQKSGGISE